MFNRADVEKFVGREEDGFNFIKPEVDLKKCWGGESKLEEFVANPVVLEKADSQSKYDFANNRIFEKFIR